MKNHYVYAPIRGQLGNQMFQYAMLRSLGIETNSTPGFTYGEKWPFALDCFNISKEFISTLNPMESTINKVFRKVFKFCMNLCPSSHKKFVFNRCCNWFFCIGGIFICPLGYVKPFIPFLKWRNIYCDGYFQSEKYFEKHKEVIKKEFTFTDEIKNRCGDLASEIISVNAVCVHIRLGDFLGLPEFCVTDSDYFHRAIKYIKEKVENPVFYVFSDEPDKARKMLGDDIVHLISPSFSGPESMYLGTLCRYHIISNSSFSWWMQYLGAKAGQIVIAPSRWYNDDKEVDGLYQKHWIKM